MIMMLFLLLCSSISMCMNDKTVAIKYGVALTQGHRLTMEDTHSIELMDQYIFFGIYDGHGGDQVAEYAKQHLHTNCNLAGRKTDDIKEALKEGFLKTHNDLDEIGYQQGSTAIVALLQKNHLFVANAGDSRAVLCKAGKAMLMSEDHKPKRPDEEERIQNLGGKIIFNKGAWRVTSYSYNLAVSRTLGDKILHPYVIPDPEIKDKVLEQDDQFLILACDGLWDVMSNQYAVDYVTDKLFEYDHDYKKVAKDLVQEALRRNSKDNISAIIVNLKPLTQQ